MLIGGSPSDREIESAVDSIIGEKLARGGSLSLSVRTPSMRFLIRPGDRVRIRAVARGAIAPGDIVAVRRRGGYLVHRVIEIRVDAGQPQVRTKGDLNQWSDDWVPASDVVGRVTAIQRGHKELSLSALPMQIVSALSWRGSSRIAADGPLRTVGGAVAAHLRERRAFVHALMAGLPDEYEVVGGASARAAAVQWILVTRAADAPRRFWARYRALGRLAPACGRIWVCTPDELARWQRHREQDLGRVLDAVARVARAHQDLAAANMRDLYGVSPSSAERSRVRRAFEEIRDGADAMAGERSGFAVDASRPLWTYLRAAERLRVASRRLRARVRLAEWPPPEPAHYTADPWVDPATRTLELVVPANATVESIRRLGREALAQGAGDLAGVRLLARGLSGLASWTQPEHAARYFLQPSADPALARSWLGWQAAELSRFVSLADNERLPPVEGLTYWGLAESLRAILMLRVAMEQRMLVLKAEDLVRLVAEDWIAEVFERGRELDPATPPHAQRRLFRERFQPAMRAQVGLLTQCVAGDAAAPYVGVAR